VTRTEKRFWAKVDRTGRCWLWTAGVDSCGYGVFWYEGAPQRAHRVSWQLTRGRIPRRRKVLHRCDTPGCVRPTHLRLGTQRDNILDCVARGRTNPRSINGPRPRVLPRGGRRGGRGEFNGHAKLTAAQVRRIRVLKVGGKTNRALSAQFGVDPSHISGIVNRRGWKNI
jgi:hypothetical protein